MKLDLERFAPPGVNLKNELLMYMWTNIFAVIYSMGFIFRYIDAFDSLYVYKNMDRVLNTSAKMDPFAEILGNGYIGFYIPVLAAIVMIFYHYRYYHQDSKSIYLMKRLPKRFLIVKQCVTIPIIAIFATLMVFALIMMIYYAIYRFITPDVCLYDAIAIVNVLEVK